jgi:hypothetical protein
VIWSILRCIPETISTKSHIMRIDCYVSKSHLPSEHWGPSQNANETQYQISFHIKEYSLHRIKYSLCMSTKPFGSKPKKELQKKIFYQSTFIWVCQNTFILGAPKYVCFVHVHVYDLYLFFAIFWFNSCSGLSVFYHQTARAEVEENRLFFLIRGSSALGDGFICFSVEVRGFCLGLLACQRCKVSS